MPPKPSPIGKGSLKWHLISSRMVLWYVHSPAPTIRTLWCAVDTHTLVLKSGDGDTSPRPQAQTHIRCVIDGGCGLAVSSIHIVYVTEARPRGLGLVLLTVRLNHRAHILLESRPQKCLLLPVFPAPSYLILPWPTRWTRSTSCSLDLCVALMTSALHSLFPGSCRRKWWSSERCGQ